MPISNRLSAVDALFVGIETQELHMHVGALLIFDRGPLAKPEGGIDFDRIKSYVSASLSELPNYQRRLRKIPGLRHPVWIDDTDFQLAYHLRHTALPCPGDERQLKRLAGRIFSQPLDRQRPLWEIWVVEGLSENRFALIGKVHHAMVDGIGGVEVLAALLSGCPEPPAPPSRPSFHPQAAPTSLSLLRDELRYRRSGLKALAKRAQNTWKQVRAGGAASAEETARGVWNVLRNGLAPTSATSINLSHVGAQRRFDVCRFELSELKAIKNSLGGKLGDVILALSAGALRRYLSREGDRVDRLDSFRVMMPVSTRGSASSRAGNHIALTMLNLPVHLCDPLERYKETLRASAAGKKGTHQVQGATLLEEISDVTSRTLMQQSVRIAGAMRSFNVVITNVPGPPFGLYLLGAPLLEMFPLVPLFHHQGLGIAVFSYNGKVGIGLGADWQALRNLHELVDDFYSAMAELQEVAAEVDRQRDSGRGPSPDLNS